MTIAYEYFDCGVKRCISKRDLNLLQPEFQKVKSLRDEELSKFANYIETLASGKGKEDSDVIKIMTELVETKRSNESLTLRLEQRSKEIEKANEITSELEKENQQLRKLNDEIMTSYEMDESIQKKIALMKKLDNDTERMKIEKKHIDTLISKGEARIFLLDEKNKSILSQIQRAGEELTQIKVKIREINKMKGKKTSPKFMQKVGKFFKSKK